MRLITALLLCLLIPTSLSAETYPGPYTTEVLRVIDGDTITMRIAEKECPRKKTV